MLCGMSLFPCPSCKQSVSKKAKACPHCGRAFKRDNQMSVTDPVHLIGGILVLGFLVAFVVAIIRGL